MLHPFMERTSFHGTKVETCCAASLHFSNTEMHILLEAVLMQLEGVNICGADDS